jgi:hypothetical protein
MKGSKGKAAGMDAETVNNYPTHTFQLVFDRGMRSSELILVPTRKW